MNVRKLLAGSLFAFVLAAVGCGSDSGDSTSNGEGTGTLRGGGKTLVMFGPASTDLYVIRQQEAARRQAEELGYKLKIYENNFDQAQEDQQVQQYVATGAKPAAFLWWPSDAEAGINSTRALARIAPVIQFNQLVQPQGARFISAYSGPNDVGVGEIAGDLALKARDAAVKAGKRLASPGGNLIEISFPEGYRGGDDRHQGFVNATKEEPFTLIRKEPAGFDAQSGFKVANQLIPQYRSRGIDFIYTSNSGLASGVVRALKQNNLVPGKDVIVIAGDANGDKPDLKSGELSGAVVQSPSIEGALVVRTAAKFLAAGKAMSGTVQLEPTPTVPKITPDPPAKTTFMPLAPITPETFGGITVWGMGVEELVV